MKNILLTCLSPVKLDKNSVRKNKYYSRLDGEQEYSICVNGFMANEAPAAYVIQRLAVEKTERLDGIVLLCSDTVRGIMRQQDDSVNQETVEVSYDQGQIIQDEAEIFYPTCKALREKSHLEYYLDEVGEYIRGNFAEIYENHPVISKKVELPDISEGVDVAKAAVEAADKILQEGEKVKLYIDFNGGPRYVAFMVLSIANLMKIRGVEIEEILTMNYENKRGNCIPIQNMRGVFDCVDLVSGINEYVNYGRIKMLKKYFEKCNNTEIKEILRVMEEFADNLQLCRTDLVLSTRNSLKECLDTYLQRGGLGDKANTYEILFSYVINDIYKEFEALLKGTMPAVILWCVNKGFVQQALTFYVERMPVYFWESGILAPTAEEEQKYHAFYEECKPGGKYEAMKNHYQNYDEKYCWMTKALAKGQYKQYYDKEPKWKEGDFNLQSAENRKILKRVSAGEVEYSVGNAKNILQYIGVKGTTGLARTKCAGRIAEFVMDYYLLKQQRNLTNHAYAGTTSKDKQQVMWSCDEICNLLKHTVKKILDLEGK